MDVIGNPYLPSVNLRPYSEWIVFLESPYDNDRLGNAELLDRMNKVNADTLFNRNNFFNLYSFRDGAICLEWSEGKDGLLIEQFPKYILEDIKTLINLQNNPTLLLESNNSYEKYYDSMKEELSQRVFKKLFTKYSIK